MKKLYRIILCLLLGMVSTGADGYAVEFDWRTALALTETEPGVGFDPHTDGGFGLNGDGSVDLFKTGEKLPADEPDKPAAEERQFSGGFIASIPGPISILLFGVGLVMLATLVERRYRQSDGQERVSGADTEGSHHRTTKGRWWPGQVFKR